jgi:hypothetical protein
MRLINKNSKRGIVNLFADFILSKIKKTEKSIIQVTDCGPFMVVNGLTTSSEYLDINEIKNEFKESFSDLLKDLEMSDINTIDVISYNQDINTIHKGWVMVNKKVFVEEPEPEISEISISSEFPYGYSLDCGRLNTYYSHYIMNHMFNLLGVDEVSFYFTTEQDESEDIKIKIISNSNVDKKSIKSLILDVFDFNMGTFRDCLSDYNLIDDILNPDGEKPYLKQDLLEHIILF